MYMYYIYIYMYIQTANDESVRRRALLRDEPHDGRALGTLHPVSITRFPLTRFSPGAGLLRNPFVHR